MDSSPVFINMCTSAAKLRTMWSPEIGDFYHSGHSSNRGLHVVTKLPHSRTWNVWLPRADQLFSIAEARYTVHNKAPYVLNQLTQFMLDVTPEHHDTIEKMLMHFVMSKLFNVRYLLRSWIPIRRA